jgi:hypothetical protein
VTQVTTQFTLFGLTISPFFLCIHTVTCIVYPDLLEVFLMSILEEEGPSDVPLQQGGVPSHFHNKVTGFSNQKFPEKRIGRGGLVT